MLVLAYCGMLIMATCAFAGNQTEEEILPCNLTGDCPSDSCCLSIYWTPPPSEFNYTRYSGTCNPMSQFKDLCRMEDITVTNLTDKIFERHCPCTPDLLCKTSPGKIWIDIALGEIGHCDIP